MVVICFVAILNLFLTCSHRLKKTTMGHIWTVVTLILLQAVGSMGLLRTADNWASNRVVESVGLGPSDKWVYMGRKRA